MDNEEAIVAEKSHDSSIDAYSDGLCIEEASPEFISEKTLALKVSNGDNEIDDINGDVNKDKETEEENVSVVEQSLENTGDATPIVTSEREANDNSIELTESNNTDQNGVSQIAEPVINEPAIEKFENEESKVEKQQGESTEQVEYTNEINNIEQVENKDHVENKDQVGNTIQVENTDREQITEKVEITEKEQTTEESIVKATPIEDLMEPISPANGELSPEREEDFQDEEEIEQNKKKDEEKTRYSPPAPIITIQPLKNMLEDIEEGELDYEDDGDLDDLPDLPEYDPSTHGKKEIASEDGEIISDNDEDGDDEREEGEIRDEDETGQVYICVDSKSDKWKKVSKSEQKQLQELEEGQIEEDESPTTNEALSSTPGRFIPRTLCKYYNNGLCRWGSTCRFLHPGVNDKGIPNDIQPTWNATAGNYAMLRPPGMYPNAYGKAPPPMECINVPVMTTPVVMVDGNKNSEIMGIEETKKESAWERGLRRAKEVKEAAARRRQEDADFEEKRLNMKIPEYYGGNEKEQEVFEQEQQQQENYQSSQNKPYQAEHDYRDKPPLNDNYHFDRRGRPPPSENRPYKNDRYHPNASKDVDRSSGRARIAELPPFHPIRREERQRQREREKRREREERDKRDRERGEHREENRELYDPRKPPVDEPSRPPPPKNVSATEWHDPWMRTQNASLTGQKPDAGKSGIEAVSDSSSSDSDSDSDSDSSSSGKSSGSGSDSSSSGDEKRKKGEQRSSGDPRRRERNRSSTEIKERGTGDKNEPLSYADWKRQQSLQNSQRHQQPQQQQHLSSHNKNSPPERRDRYNRDMHRMNKPPSTTRPDDRRAVQDPRMNSVNTATRRQEPQGRVEPASKPVVAKNDDKFDSPKRKQHDSDSGSDSDSDSDDSDSDSESSDSDSDDTDTDSDSDADAAKTAAAKTEKNISAKPLPTKAASPVITSVGGTKRPARKDDLLKELKAVEDAIARKRAKID